MSGDILDIESSITALNSYEFVFYLADCPVRYFICVAQLIIMHCTLKWHGTPPYTMIFIF